MPKLTRPLLSGAASGKLADAVVYSQWFGRNIVRWLPHSTKSSTIDQKINRQKFALMSKLNSKLHRPKRCPPNGSKLYQQLRKRTPGQRTWCNYVMKKILPILNIDIYFLDLSDALYALPTDTFNLWKTSSSFLGIRTLTNAKIYATAISPSLQLYTYAFGIQMIEITSYDGLMYPPILEWTTNHILYFTTSFRFA